MISAHPFGGFNISGPDSKAGGPDYLLLLPRQIHSRKIPTPKPNKTT